MKINKQNNAKQNKDIDVKVKNLTKDAMKCDSKCIIAECNNLALRSSVSVMKATNPYR